MAFFIGTPLKRVREGRSKQPYCIEQTIDVYSFFEAHFLLSFQPVVALQIGIIAAVVMGRIGFQYKFD